MPGAGFKRFMICVNLARIAYPSRAGVVANCRESARQLFDSIAPKIPNLPSR